MSLRWDTDGKLPQSDLTQSPGLERSNSKAHINIIDAAAKMIARVIGTGLQRKGGTEGSNEEERTLST